MIGIENTFVDGLFLGIAGIITLMLWYFLFKEWIYHLIDNRLKERRRKRK